MVDIMLVMDAAKKIMRQSGNMYQWGEGYPSEAVITADLERNGGFIIEDEGCIVGYFAFLPSPEPTYAKINEGKWIDDTATRMLTASSAASWSSAFRMTRISA